MIAAQASPRVAVVGAGIGGLAAAVALRRRGLEPTLYDQAEEFAEVGAGVAIGANASRLLERLGLGDALRADAVLPSHAQFHRWAGGEVFCSHELGDHYTGRFGSPYYTVHRGHLHRLLLDGFADGALHLGHKCVSVTEDADGVELVFDNGVTTRADIVIGADGVHSALREALWGPQEATFSGTSGLRGLTPIDHLPLGPGFDPRKPALWLFPGPGRHFICYPVSGGRLINFLGVVPDRHWTQESWVTRGDVGEAVAAFDGWNTVVTSILAGARSIGKWALYDREPLYRWSTSRVTLLGDAAHAMLPHHGQGANQAIEDAVVLAGQLDGVREPAGIAEALRRYEALRKPRSRQLQIGSRTNGDCFQVPDGPEALKRDERLTHLADNVAWIHGFDAEAELGLGV
ncbi:FAD-dependent monooxygenase [Amycolatopsis sp. cmx-11-32]|uniref:FAD-dependent monooxygenase n=1 Tax=Amycolatopsis sp. cmx-11-32 TaxID=2785796 RepID=UPI0039E49E37